MILDIFRRKSMYALHEYLLDLERKSKCYCDLLAINIDEFILNYSD